MKLLHVGGACQGAERARKLGGLFMILVVRVQPWLVVRDP